MVCYARPASWLVAILTVAWLVFSGPVSHFFGTAAVLVAVLAATGGAAVAAAVVFATLMSTRRRRAAAGGCVNCQFRCQHAMTGPGQALAGGGRGPQAGAAGRRTRPFGTCLAARAGGAAGRPRRLRAAVAGPAPSAGREPRSRGRQDGIGRPFGVLVEAPASSAGSLGLVHGQVGTREQGPRVLGRQPGGPAVGLAEGEDSSQAVVHHPGDEPGGVPGEPARGPQANAAVPGGIPAPQPGRGDQGERGGRADRGQFERSPPGRARSRRIPAGRRR